MANRSATLARRLLLPGLGLALTAALVAQSRGGDVTAPHTAAATSSRAAGRIVAEGRLVTYPGAEVGVGTEVAGLLSRVEVREKEPVRRGQLLAELRAEDLRAEIDEARARIVEAEAEARFAESERGRIAPLAERGVETKNRLERVERDRDTALARRATAAAAVVRLEAKLAKMRILSPIDGIVVARSVDAGETVGAGQALFTVANLDRTRVEAEIDEFDAGHVTLGAKVEVTAEGLDGQSWPGTVEEIPDQVVPRRTRPQDPGRPSDTRVLLVKVALPGPTPLKLGQRVEVAIGG